MGGLLPIAVAWTGAFLVGRWLGRGTAAGVLAADDRAEA
jgi:hypothetical protein